MVEGSIVFNCFETNENLRDFSRVKCWVQALEPANQASCIFGSIVTLELTYWPRNGEAVVTHHVQFHAAAWSELCKSIEQLSFGRIEGPT